MLIKELMDTLDEKMNKTLDLFSRDLNGLRTGRASVNILDPVIVEAYGDKLPLSQLATISTPEATTIQVQPWDQSMIKKIEKSISEANLGLNTNADGNIIRINVPPLSEERRKDLVKLAHKYGENSKVTIRNIRRDGMDQLKKKEKANDLSQDQQHIHADKIQQLTDDFIKKIDIKLKKKESEIMTI